MTGLESRSKFDNLLTLLSGAASATDIIAITETSENKDNSFTSNIEIDGYKLSSTPTNSSKGGTALYVNKDFEFNRNRNELLFRIYMVSA